MGEMTADTTATPSSTAVQPSTTPVLPTTTPALHTTTSVLPTTTSALPTTTSALPTTTFVPPSSTSTRPTSTSVLPSSASALPQSASVQHSPAITPPLYTTPIKGSAARVVCRLVSVRASLAARWKTGWWRRAYNLMPYLTIPSPSMPGGINCLRASVTVLSMRCLM